MGCAANGGCASTPATPINVCAPTRSSPPAASAGPSVSGILNAQLSIPVNRARGTPEAQVAQLQVDTLSCGREPRSYLPLSKQGCGNGDAKCDVGRCVKGKHSRGAAAETEAELSACSGCRRIDTLGG